jgi:NTE family protein
MDKGWEDRLPVFEKTLSIVKDHGIYEGDYFLDWMRELLAKKDVHTFADLRHKPPTDGHAHEFEHRLQVIVSDVTTHEMLVLPRDAEKLGYEPDELEVALAVRMSMSIPIFFEPVFVTNPRDKREHVLVDGGMLSNYPVWLFDCHGREPRWPTFGLLLVEPDPKTPVGEELEQPERARRGALGLVPFLKSLAQTMMQAHDRMYVEEANWARTIGIPTLGVGTTEFGLPHDRALELYESGRAAAQKFLDRWSFEGYLAEFRSGKTHSRSEKIAEKMRDAAPA